MSSSRTWPPVAAALAVVCTAVLAVFCRWTAVGAVAGVLGIVCVSAIYLAVLATNKAQGGQTEPGASGVSAEELTRLIEKTADGEDVDFSSLPTPLAAALSNLAARLEGQREELAELRPRNPVTSLYTERVFDNALWREFNRAQRYDEPMSLALLEMEGLGDLRAREGGEAADSVLKGIASVVLQMIRETDLAAHYGEEKLVVIMPGTGGEGAEEFAGRFRKFLEEGKADAPASMGGISVSIGTACVPEEGTKTAPELVGKAAAALKRSGRAEGSGV